MIKPNQFNSMLNWSHVAAAIFKALFAYVGFLTWGYETQEEITNNLPTQGFKATVNICLVIKALLSYPLPFYAAADILEQCLFRGKPETFFNSVRKPDDSYTPLGIGLKMALVSARFFLRAIVRNRPSRRRTKFPTDVHGALRL